MTYRIVLTDGNEQTVEANGRLEAMQAVGLERVAQCEVIESEPAVSGSGVSA